MISTSPTSRSTKVVVAARPPVSKTGTLSKILVTNAFHLGRRRWVEGFLGVGGRREVGVAALPDVLGFGKMIFTSSRARSSQSLMPLGLPARTRKDGSE